MRHGQAQFGAAHYDALSNWVSARPPQPAYLPGGLAFDEVQIGPKRRRGHRSGRPP
jgi:hypothetical protein